MRIGDLAQAAGVSTRSLRYYEQKQLLKPARGSNGYREYDSTALQRVRNIRMLIEAGFGCDEIRQFGDCLGRDLNTEPACEEVLDLGEGRLRELESRIVGLLETHGRLQEPSANCSRPAASRRGGHPRQPLAPPTRSQRNHQQPPVRQSSERRQ